MARKPGSHTVQPGQTRVRYRAWQAMRYLREFNVGQLMAVAEIERANAAKFVRALARTGYLRQVQPAYPARRMFAQYRLIRDSGPRVPVIRSVGEVFDANTGHVYMRVGTDGWTIVAREPVQ